MELCFALNGSINSSYTYYSLLSWWDPFNYAMSHRYHHRYTLHPEGDREMILPLTPSLRPTFLLQMFTINLFTQSGRPFGKGGLIPTIIITIKVALGLRISVEIPSREYKPCTLISRTRHENQCGGHG